MRGPILALSMAVVLLDYQRGSTTAGDRPPAEPPPGVPGPLRESKEFTW